MLDNRQVCQWILPAWKRLQCFEKKKNQKTKKTKNKNTNKNTKTKNTTHSLHWCSSNVLQRTRQAVRRRKSVRRSVCFICCPSLFYQIVLKMKRELCIDFFRVQVFLRYWQVLGEQRRKKKKLL